MAWTKPDPESCRDNGGDFGSTLESCRDRTTQLYSLDMWDHYLATEGYDLVVAASGWFNTTPEACRDG